MNNRTNIKNLFNIIRLIIIIMLTAATTHAQQPGSPADSGYAPVNGIKVYYKVYGQGQPLVLLHGAFMTIDGNWGKLIPELSKNHKVIALELQGHGHTPYSDRKLSHATLAGDVAGVMDYLHIDSADVAGYSFGGAIAYQFAIQHPRRLKKLVIISATYKSEGWLPQVNAAFKQMKPEFFDQSPMHAAYNAVAPDTTKWIPFLQQMIASAQQPFNLGDANIANITAPVLIIAGDNDGLDKLGLIKTYQLLGGNVVAGFGPAPASQLAIVPGQGHVSLMEQTATLLNYFNGFLK
ncbi:alpha/beta fold hydrolase [Niabella drilacis]|uniref:Pimeloyl-ACP methyl ester carboxylesterase n=1 Tax=Niabella drilacis (strain DSM 25811 / CCM 8410 / CCUG 62505 / LMG 26954 / E90) TaxID=1285928 RepID=A0A1G7A8U7_NIADE|nr:alpha/beta hydrolase [Niabella drilacis]SDE11249.1 Pimeloyl-ACP methyl ester carboxylesterase [Niabella drilacis]